ncbi:MAG: toll/interleukin-1 receptor domain-containing protein [Candidatus Sulfotelmatobacter sp.]
MDNYPATSGRVARAPEVMVSYSSQDRDRVMEFVRALRAAGVAVWIDQGGIDGAQRWSEEIVNAIEACRTMMLFISRTSMESQNISREVALAWESGKHFLPVALEEAKIPKSMQYQLAGIQYVKLYEGDPEAKFESLLRALVRLGVRVSPYSMAVISAGMGDREQTLEWLAKACEEHSGALARLTTEPRFNPMRSDPRFSELARRAEALVLDLEDASAEIVLPQPLKAAPQRTNISGATPAWKHLLWPDIVDAKSAREATALAVWASAAIIAARWVLSFLVAAPTVTGLGWWNDPIVLTLIFAAIGFGVQKMGRPAAVI